MISVLSSSRSRFGQQIADQLPCFIDKPIGIAEYQLVRALPEPREGKLPSIEEIEEELSGELEGGSLDG